MRVLAAVFILFSATAGAGASSLMVVDNSRPVASTSVVTLGDKPGGKSSPSLVRLGPPASAADHKTIDETAETGSAPVIIQDLPMVIRAGEEGAAFARAVPVGQPAAAPEQPADAAEPQAAVPLPPADTPAQPPAAAAQDSAPPTVQPK